MIPVNKKLKVISESLLKIQKKEKYGSLNYLAQWQGLRGEDLDIDLTAERETICAKTGMKVIFTCDAAKYAEP